MRDFLPITERLSRIYRSLPSELVGLPDYCFKISNSAGQLKHGWLEVRNEANRDAAEILIYNKIGKGWYSDDGIAAKEFDAALKAIPEGRKINIRINSPGGEVWDGFAMYNMIERRSADVTVYIDGIAASIASVIAMAGSRLIMPKNSLLMIHEAQGLGMGSAAEMRDLADRLDKHSDMIAGVYADKSGMTKEEARAKMRAETWFTGQEAFDSKLADEVTNEASLSASLDFDLSAFRRVPVAIVEQIKNSAAKRSGHENTHMREKIIALLKAHGIAFENSATDEQLAELLNKIQPPKQTDPPPAPQNADETSKTIKALQDAVTALTEQNKNERKSRVTNAVNKAAEEGRIPANQAETWVKRAMADETVLTDLAALPERLPGYDPVAVQITAEDPKSIEKGIMRLWGQKPQQDEEAMINQARKSGLERAKIINQNFKRLWEYIVNTNTVATDLKRTVILQQMIRAFAIRILPLKAFCSVFNGVRLQGTDKVAVPYFPLITTTSVDFNASNGYDTGVNTNSDAKTVTVNKRKYQRLSWTSSELARQPFMDLGMAALLAGEQLGLDSVNDVLSAVTIANFATVGKSSPAGSFDSDDVIDLMGSADTANWPGAGRSMILNSAYDVNLLKDNAIKSAMNFGDNGPIIDGRITRVGGFQYFKDARVPTNSQNLQGFINFVSAMLVGFAPINPTVEVRAQLTRYEVVTDPETNATFEYRLWGDALKDTSYEVIEANYGYVAGEAAALQRITT